MGLFSKNKKEETKKKDSSNVPELPRLPELPKFHVGGEEESSQWQRNQLPSFPHSSIGDKLSQNTIKDAVSGEEEGEEADELEDFEKRTQMTPRRNSFTREEDFEQTPQRREINSDYTYTENKRNKNYQKKEPVFVRIDKFEEGLKIFENLQEKIIAVERMLRDIQKIKKEEEEELNEWEKEIQTLKEQIEQVNNDIFSKLE
ncbi:hypothetical protein K9L16_01030 [Candidatus Pacearchaeota archaeon]|nr:hypothetical protein [Candidatus Pacearchaeota archaeon]